MYKYSKYLLATNAYGEAIDYLLKLEQNADFSQNVIFAQSNLMKSYYQTKNYRKVLDISTKVLNNPKIETYVKNDAQLFKARAALALGEKSEAEKAYKAVSKTTSGKQGAEAAYQLAKMNYEKGAYKTSNGYIQQLAQKYSKYRSYSAKGLVIMARNFYGLKDAYQATYVLESLIQNFSEFKDTIKEAKTLLKQIKAQEAKTNSSITQ